MASLELTVNGLKLPNPFLIGSGPPGTNAHVIGRALDEGWGGAVAKTISLDASKVVNIAPRYARLRSESGEIIGWENIELISDRPFVVWMEEFKQLRDKYPQAVIVGSIMEEYHKDRWCEIVERTQATGVSALELNFSCPHGLPERKMGSAMGQNTELMEEVCGWVMSVAKVPVWAKLTPNITHIDLSAAAAFRAGCQGISAINTILCVMGIDLDTLRPEPTVEGLTTPGGYSCLAVKPIALRMVKECADVVRTQFSDRTISGIGGVETGNDAAMFLLLGAHTVQVCTGVMKHGYGMIRRLQDELLAFMERHKFQSIDEFRGYSLQYFTTHADLVERQANAKAAKAKARAVVTRDNQWRADEFVDQSEALSHN
jgi:dihydropyrimidine dehydrogenase (NADP+)/dihydropyrimidine dehydrogenase (NAD+) subunit PreA